MNKKEKCGAMKIAKFINQNQIRPSNHRPLNIPHIGPRKNANLLNLFQDCPNLQILISY